ncbi:MAG: efflux RND transporter periplasmic adaptor subunit [Nitrospirae bacterium]|nr:efflux RND transporter periplasmic adaptor subunit [Nitrospirota bacterium]
MRIKWVIYLLIIAGVTGIILYIYIPEKKATDSEPSKLENPKQIVAATGKVEGWIESEIGSKIQGRISEIKVKEGDYVRKGDPLVILDKGDLEAKKEEAKVDLRQAILDLDKYRNLYKDGVISKRDLEVVETRHEKVLSIINQVDSALEDMIIRAPFSGRIVKKYKEIGETVGSLTSPEYIVKIADVSRVKVRAEVEESDMGKVVIGQKALIKADAYPGVEFMGEVVKVGYSVGKKRLRADDPRERIDTKVIETEIELKDIKKIKDKIKIGMTVEVKIEINGRNDRF